MAGERKHFVPIDVKSLNTAASAAVEAPHATATAYASLPKTAVASGVPVHGDLPAESFAYHSRSRRFEKPRYFNRFCKWVADGARSMCYDWKKNPGKQTAKLSMAFVTSIVPAMNAVTAASCKGTDFIVTNGFSAWWNNSCTDKTMAGINGSTALFTNMGMSWVFIPLAYVTTISVIKIYRTSTDATSKRIAVFIFSLGFCLGFEAAIPNFALGFDALLTLLGNEIATGVLAGLNTLPYLCTRFVGSYAMGKILEYTIRGWNLIRKESIETMRQLLQSPEIKSQFQNYLNTKKFPLVQYDIGMTDEQLKVQQKQLEYDIMTDSLQQLIIIARSEQRKYLEDEKSTFAADYKAYTDKHVPSAAAGRGLAPHNRADVIRALLIEKHLIADISYTKLYALIIFDGVIAGFFAATSFFAFAIKGRDGLVVLGLDKNNMNLGTAFPQGIATSCFYFNTIVNVRDVMQKYGNYLVKDIEPQPNACRMLLAILKNKWHVLLGFVAFATANAFGGASMQGVDQNLINRFASGISVIFSDLNILSGPTGNFFLYIIRVDATLTNFTALLGYLLKSNPELKQQGTLVESIFTYLLQMPLEEMHLEQRNFRDEAKRLNLTEDMKTIAPDVQYVVASDATPVQPIVPVEHRPMMSIVADPETGEARVALIVPSTQLMSSRFNTLQFMAECPETGTRLLTPPPRIILESAAVQLAGPASARAGAGSVDSVLAEPPALDDARARTASATPAATQPVTPPPRLETGTDEKRVSHLGASAPMPARTRPFGTTGALLASASVPALAQLAARNDSMLLTRGTRQTAATPQNKFRRMSRTYDPTIFRTFPGTITPSAPTLPPKGAAPSVIPIP